jgi:hypothetical protein
MEAQEVCVFALDESFLQQVSSNCAELKAPEESSLLHRMHDWPISVSFKPLALYSIVPQPRVIDARWRIRHKKRINKPPQNKI